MGPPPTTVSRLQRAMVQVGRVAVATAMEARAWLGRQAGTKTGHNLVT